MSAPAPEKLNHMSWIATAEKSGGPGTWSRRITDEHRLVYLVDGQDIIVLQARYHY